MTALGQKRTAIMSAVRFAHDLLSGIGAKYITIWHKSGDNWQITDDIWNLNK